MTDPCIRCGIHPADPACDWLHCADCFPLVCDEIATGWAQLDAERADEPDADDDICAADLLAANDATDDEIPF